jgi:hypothetical protein
MKLSGGEKFTFCLYLSPAHLSIFSVALNLWISDDDELVPGFGRWFTLGASLAMI